MKYDLTSLDQLRQTALGARDRSAKVAAVALKAVEDVVDLLPIRREAVLAAGSWAGTAAPFTQTVAVAGVRADEAGQRVEVVPKTASLAAWDAAGVRCTVQAAGALAFTAKVKPAANINIFVVLQEVLG